MFDWGGTGLFLSDEKNGINDGKSIFVGRIGVSRYEMGI